MDPTDCENDFAIFTNDNLLPSQFADRLRSRHLTPEQVLAIAIVKQAERDLYSTKRVRYHRAREWFLSKAKDHPFAFSCLCEYLNVRPIHLRRRARRTKFIRERQVYKAAA